jgi:hypothetical protein
MRYALRRERPPLGDEASAKAAAAIICEVIGT